jgi:hypothetical protein
LVQGAQIFPGNDLTVSDLIAEMFQLKGKPGVGGGVECGQVIGDHANFDLQRILLYPSHRHPLSKHSLVPKDQFDPMPFDQGEDGSHLPLPRSPSDFVTKPGSGEGRDVSQGTIVDVVEHAESPSLRGIAGEGDVGPFPFSP